MSSNPRQEFLGPITKLAAIQRDGYWFPDGYGIVDGYGAEFKNLTIVLNGRTSAPSTGIHKGSFWVNDLTIPTTPWFTDSNGNSYELGTGGGGGVPLGPLNTVYWSDGVTNQWTNIVTLGGPQQSPAIYFGRNSYSPIIEQIMSLGDNGQDFTIAAQSVNGTGDGNLKAGDLWLESGWASDPSNDDGVLQLWAGRGGINLWTNRMEFVDSEVNPRFGQMETSNATGNYLQIYAQRSTTGTGGVLYLQGGQGSVQHGNVLIINGNVTNTEYSHSLSTGFLVRHSGRLELVDQGAFNNNSSVTGSILQASSNTIIAASQNNFSSYTLDAYPLGANMFNIPRKDKKFGVFRLTGTSNVKYLNFNTSIHSNTMAPNSIEMGTFMIGWMGNGNYTNGGAVQFIFTITSDGSGNILRINTSLNNSACAPGGTITLLSGSNPSASNGDNIYVCPTGTNTPLINISALGGTTFQISVQSTYAGGPSEYTRYCWEMEIIGGSSL